MEPSEEEMMDRMATNQSAEINPLEQIQIRDEALEQHRQHLEEEVAQRTAALEEANVLLGKELAERKAAEQELQAANEQLSILLDSLPIAVYRCRAEGDYAVMYMSQNVVFFTGYEAGNFIEEADLWFKRIHPDDAARVTAEMATLFEKGMNAFAYRWQDADGNYRWIQDSQRLIRHRDGTPDYMVGMWQDITESKNLELRLRESEQRFRNVAELTTDWVWQIDASGTYVYSGAKVHDLLGYNPEEVCGKTPFDFMPPDEAARVAEIFKNIASKKIPFSFLENINLHKDGHRVILETSGVPLLGDDGIFHGYFGTERDITERKLAAQALEDSERKFRAILDAAVDGILVADVQTLRLVTANRAICDMLGYSPEEIYRLGLEDIHPAEALSHVKKQFERQMERDIRVAPNMPVKRKDGSVFYADVSSSPMVLAGRPYLVGVFHDVTERRQAEENVREINEVLEEKVRARTRQLLEAQEDLLRKEKLAVLGQVAGSVGHELRNPLGISEHHQGRDRQFRAHRVRPAGFGAHQAAASGSGGIRGIDRADPGQAHNTACCHGDFGHPGNAFALAGGCHANPPSVAQSYQQRRGSHAGGRCTGNQRG
ncbi:MAG: hypothetical protein B7Y40_06600 [Gammaproteobacteria bacterium 28-57-27]|nr:MAG: hypothetical protein B7Y40_06600 [Gammaproteobacteria bacterium 28-57-27]